MINSPLATQFLAAAKILRAKRIYKQCIRLGHNEIANSIQLKYNLK